MKMLLAALMLAAAGAFGTFAGTYTNPIVTADFSDPDVVRVGDDFYMTASSFNMVPGLPILHSRNLVDWRLVGHGLRHLPPIPEPTPRRSGNELDYDLPRPGCGVYAPSIRFHDGWFWIFWGDPDAGIYMTRARNAAGPWSEPHLVHPGQGLIDTTPLWDDTAGKAYLAHAYAHSRSGINGRIVVHEMAWDGSRLIGAPATVFDASKPERFPSDRHHSVIEGAKFMQRDGWYYLLCPAGGVAFGWQTALRARSPMGPYEIRTICARGSTDVNGPHQGALVDTPQGSWWFVHFQDVGTLGRITWLQPARWEDAWPVIGEDPDGDGTGQPVHLAPLPVDLREPLSPTLGSDSFNGPEIGLQWQWPANPKPGYSLLEDGILRLPAHPVPDGRLECAPHVLTQMFPGYCFAATAKVELDSTNPSVYGGLAAMGRTCSDIAIHRLGEGLEARVRIKGAPTAIASLPAGSIWLRLEAEGELPLPYSGKNGQIACRFAYSTNGRNFVPLGETFHARAGTWIGARVGLFCSGADPQAGSLKVDDLDMAVEDRTGRGL